VHPGTRGLEARQVGAVRDIADVDLATEAAETGSENAELAFRSPAAEAGNEMEDTHQNAAAARSGSTILML
jgi:hypothetical protein